MFEHRFLGQVPISPGAGFNGPFGMYANPGGGTYRNPSGSPLMTEQMTSPEHAGEEYHCYRAPNGSFVSIRLQDAEAYKAQGYEAADVANCSKRMGDNAPVGPGAPGSPPISFQEPSDRFVQPGFFPGFQYPPFLPTAAPGPLICKKTGTASDGTDILECTPKPPPVLPVVNYGPALYYY